MLISNWEQNKRYKAFNLREQDYLPAALVWCKELAPNEFKITNYRALERKAVLLQNKGKLAVLYMLHQGHGNQQARKHNNTVSKAKNIRAEFAALEKQAISTLEKHRAATILSNWINSML